jgi:hypothetical protein
MMKDLKVSVKNPQIPDNKEKQAIFILQMKMDTIEESS